MKKIDIVLSLVAGEGVALLFDWLLKNSQVKITLLYWLLPIVFPFLSLFCLWIAYLIGKKFTFVFQLAKFVLIGALFAVFDLAILNGLMEYFNATTGTKYLIFVTISFLVATSVKYFVDKFWAFEKGEVDKASSEFGLFFIVTAISAGIQIGIAGFVVNIIGSLLGLNPLVLGNVGKIAGIFFASAWNFIGYKFFVFKK
jgi:putative flippase GtrA